MPASSRSIVTVAASLGGIEALSALLPSLPHDFPAPIVVVQHRLKRDDDLLPRVLQRWTSMPVVPVVNGARPAARTVYVVPARDAVEIRGGRFRLVPAPVRPRPTPEQADLLMTSAAEEFGSGVIGVVLSGSLQDGAAGARAIKRAGGIVLVQDARTAAAIGMPDAAVETGCVDHVLPVRIMAAALVALVTAPGAGILLRRPAPPALHTA